MPDEKVVQADRDSAPHGDLGTLLQSQKTELVSQLAGTMANQINNIMMAITSYAELELKKATPAQKRSLEQILDNSARATFLIQKLLAFSRKHSIATGKLLLNPVINDVCRLLQPLVGEEIEVAVKLDPAVGMIIADAIEVEQLVLSLGLNARESNGGTLEVSTELVTLDPKTFGGEDLTQPGQFVMLCVHSASQSTKVRPDESSPIGQQVLRTSQAIAAVRGIVKERRGLFRVSTRPGQSTTFRVYFSALPAEASRGTTEAVAATTAAASTKTILIVEDDDAVRNPAAEFLKMEGFKVLQARTGAEALRIVQDSRSGLNLLVTDIVMAGMHGDELAAELCKTHPDLRVLYMSGDVDKVAKAGKDKSHRTHVLQKPFRLNKLNDKIRELLGD
jgi:two-component system cell cycle sensor histidine kinase/response regulator CckA